MKILKRNQIIVLSMALVLVTVGYFNYGKNTNKSELPVSTVATTSEENIGDARLVSSNSLVSNEKGNIVDNSSTYIVNNSPVEEGNYFVDSKLQRDTMYSQMLDSYQKITNSETVSSEQKTIATEEIKKINTIKNGIMISENLIKIKGFEDVVIFVNDTSINTIIKADDLKQEEIAQIQNILIRELNAKTENIHISNKP